CDLNSNRNDQLPMTISQLERTASALVIGNWSLRFSCAAVRSLTRHQFSVLFLEAVYRVVRGWVFEKVIRTAGPAAEVDAPAAMQDVHFILRRDVAAHHRALLRHSGRVFEC